MRAEIQYLFNSGFSIKTKQHFFIFDYYLDTPKNGNMHNGVIDPKRIKDENVIVFVSHSHYDHYNPVIFEWKKQISKIQYILSDDIHTTESCIFVHPGQKLHTEDFSLQVLQSTDEGSAFLIKADGLCIYHAGDLNWWNWNGETKAYNEEMAQHYKEQIDQLKGENIDIAFIPMDPRLEDKYLLGIDYFMRNVGAKLAIPMHFGNDMSALEKFKKEPLADAYRQNISVMSKRGDSILIE